MAGMMAAQPATAQDQTAAKALVESVYSVYYRDRDRVRYRELLTDDYVLLEHGELRTLERDIADMPRRAAAIGAAIGSISHW